MKKIIKNLTIGLTIILIGGFQTGALAELPNISAEGATLKLIRNGQNIELDSQIKMDIANQIKQLFNTCAVNTKSVWLREIWEKDGRSINDIWNEIKSKSYFELSFPSHSEYSEVLISIFAENGSLGTIMSKSKNGTVQGYIKCSGIGQIRLLCMPELLKYLPGLYPESECLRLKQFL